MAAQRDHHIPLDIVIAVVDEIALSNDIDSLRSCSLLSHDVLPHCRRHLFRKFDMRDTIHGHEVYFLKFNSLLSNNPHLIPYVCIVHLLDMHFYNARVGRSFMTNPSVPGFLHLLTSVKTFGLHFGTWTHWYDLVPGIQSGIMQIVGHPCCEELHLENVWNIAPSLLNSCRSLKVLAVTGSFLEGFKDKENSTKGNKMTISDPESHCIYLDSASFTTATKFVRDLYPCSSNSPLLLRFSRLRDLTITLSPQIHEALWRLIHCASTTLQRLTLNQSTEVANETALAPNAPLVIYEDAPFTLDRYSQNLRGPYVTLYPLSHLYQFSFTVIINTKSRHSVRQHLYDWCLLLRTSPPTIEEINIKLDLFFSQPPEVFHLFNPSTEIAQTSGFFDDLDKTLSNCSLFPLLDEVEIVILLADDYAYSTDSEYSVEGADGTPWPPLMEVDDIEDSVEGKMPLTSERLNGIWIDVRTGHHD